MTIAFAVFRRFPWRHVAPYVASQLVGAFAAAALLLALYGGIIERFEQSHNLVRGQPGSERTAMVYGEYFPNPAGEVAADAVPEAVAMLGEAVGTALLAMMVFAMTDRHNPGRPNGTLAALFIGLTVSVIIAVLAPLTQASLNPARDFGPRLLAFFAGWGSVAIPGPRGGFLTVYILSPIVGALAGAAAYEYLLHPAMKRSAQADKAQEQEHS
jgi:glycerol uptake facilitator protein